jgi:hypothetical protein
MWRCCAVRDCQNPTNETFLAPAPSDLIAYWTAGASTSMAAASQTQSAEPRGGFSFQPGVIAGIVISSFITGVALTLVIVISMRKRRLNQKFEVETERI